MNLFKKSSLYLALIAAVLFTSCKKDDDDDGPDKENEEEVITDVKLIFTNDDDPSDVVEARAEDPDGEGVEELKIIDEITLDTSKSYTLTFEIFNNLETPGEDIGEEIAEEDDEHQIFFSFSNDAFLTPTGNGNIDDETDPLNYNDEDGNGNPVGLSTSWSTSDTKLTDGFFTVRLQHQPDIKSGSTGATQGDTDFELQFVLNIE